MYFWTFACPLTANSPVSGKRLIVIFLLFESMLSSVTVKFDTAVGRVCESDLNGASDEPSDTSVPPTVMSSTQKPDGSSTPLPSTAGSWTVRKASSTLWPA